MRDAIDFAADVAGCSRQRIIAEAIKAGIEPTAAANAVWIAIADPTHDLDGTALRTNQIQARKRDLVGWAVWRASDLGDAPEGHGHGDDPARDAAFSIADWYGAPDPCMRPHAYCDGRVSQRTARRWQRRRRMADEAGQQFFRAFGWQAGNFGVVAGDAA